MTWTAPDVDRGQPPDFGGERESLEGWLDYHRSTLLWKCAGLTSDQLAIRPIATSTMSLLGLVRHMTFVEQIWFRIRFGAENTPPIYWRAEQPDADFELATPDTAEAAFAAFSAEVERCRAVVAGRSLDERFTFRDGTRHRDLRWVVIHMIEEYARHNGHADLIRELVDGSTGD
jgi:uncharacterized damage-inducible protein DinB